MNLSSDITLSMQVWLANDTYDHNNDPLTISATGLLNSIKQIILTGRVKSEPGLTNVNVLAASRIGTAIHDSVENAWTGDVTPLLRKVGLPDSIANRIIVNPSPEGLKQAPDAIPVYLEQRAHKKIGNYTISGKYDIVFNGKLEDIKSTSTYTYVNKTNNEKFAMQGSIYRWLNPDVITNDTMLIQYVFTDWKAMQAKTDKTYPISKIMAVELPLLSLADTQRYIVDKLNAMEQYWTSPEEDIPPCTEEELWRTAPMHKYYKNPAKKARSTKNFAVHGDAISRLAADGGVGEVVTVPGEVKRCLYCDAFDVCKQKDNYIADGSLKM